MVQLDILRGIHADLNELSFEVSQLFGLQMLFHVIGLGNIIWQLSAQGLISLEF